MGLVRARDSSSPYGEKIIKDELPPSPTAPSRGREMQNALSGDANRGESSIATNRENLESEVRNFSLVQDALFSGASRTLDKESQRDSSWQDVEDRLAILLSNDVEQMEYFHDLFERGIQQPYILASLAYLSCLHEVLEGGDGPLIDAVSRTFVYVASFDSIARYLLHRNTSVALKLDCIRTLIVTNPKCTRKDRSTSNVSNALSFVLGETVDPDALTQSDATFADSHMFWELRLQCLQEKDASDQTREARRQRIRDGANKVAYWLWSGASAIDTGLSGSTFFVTDQILDPVGIWICRQLKPQLGRGRRLEDMKLYRRRQMVATCSSAANQASAFTYTSTQNTVTGLREATVKRISAVGEKLGGRTKGCVPNGDGEAILAAAGQVGMASVAAAAIVGEAVVLSTRTLAEKTAQVTADVVNHKYGPVAGETVREMADTVGNIMKTMAYVAMFKGTSLTKIVAKDTSKAHLLRLLESRRS